MTAGIGDADEHSRYPMPDRKLVVNFMSSEIGMIATYKWLCDDAKRISELSDRIAHLERRQKFLHAWVRARRWVRPR